MELSQADIKHVAQLAKLSIAEEEIDQFTHDMQNIIKMVEELQQVDTTGVELTTHGQAIKNVYREDKVSFVNERSELMKNVPTQQDGLIQVPAMLDGGNQA